MIWGYTAAQFGAVLVSLGSTVLGLVVGYQAYRGFRRNDSRSMRYLSVGLVLLTAVSFSLAFFGTLLLRLQVLPAAVGDPLRLVVRLLQFAGLAFITYSLYSRP
ncbi:hypothetical protein I7X12_04355 [Halosimplex litoreum]|uniref:Uncharacterized protein n=1 Tax=Halosimplex litoreum TaxID=1198301 RepID=A0A7U3WBN1_9EURY|nr:hypothetical protein [Halosimplex litoreum]QPV65026.1 hypothetical protein I7X12_04355 [Halosimplex litoreum]